MTHYKDRIQELEPLVDAIIHGREERNIDYKSSMSWKDRDTKMMAIRCILGMANLRYGGYIIFGVRQQGNDFMFEGMEQDHIESFTQDNVDTDIKNYAEPFVEATVTSVSRNDARIIVERKGWSIPPEFSDDGGDFVVIQVKEFDELPVICKKTGKLKSGEIYLREGAIYTRPRGKVETSEIRTQTGMREVIDLAVDKNLRRLVDRMERIGITKPISPEFSDEERFNNQLGEVK
jgi:predicted HTH transcriptional regulator